MSTSDSTSAAAATGDRADRLDSWKEIAGYLNRDVRTVQRWEKKEGLPVHRRQHEKLGTIYAYRTELDAWWRSSETKLAAVESEVESSARADAYPDEMEEFELDSGYREPAAWRRRLTVAAVFVAVVTVAWGLWRWAGASNGTGVPPGQPRVRLLVLPLENLSGDAGQTYFSMGMTEQINAELARLNPADLGVIARSTAERYPGKSMDEIRRELKVDYVVEGSVFRAGDKVRVTAELIRADNEMHLWAQSYEGDMQDVIGMQRQVAEAIAHEVSVRAGPPQQAKRVDPEAFDAFLRGRYFWNKRGPESLQKAMTYFQQAISKDPAYAPAYAGLADGYALLGSTQTGVLPPTVAFPRAKAAAQQALTLDPSRAEPHATLGYIQLVYERDLPGAKQEFDRAIELDPHYATAHQWLGLYYVVRGDAKAAVTSVERALQEDPLSLPVNISLAEAHYFGRDYDKAVEQARRALELDGDSALAHFNLGRAYEKKKMYSEAIAEFQEARRRSPNAAPLVPLAHGYALAGDPGKARAQAAELERLAQRQYVPAIYFAVVYTGLGDRDAAFRWLDRAVEEHCDYLVFLESDPMADPLRSDGRFSELNRRLAIKR